MTHFCSEKTELSFTQVCLCNFILIIFYVKKGINIILLVKMWKTSCRFLYSVIYNEVIKQRFY